MIQCTQREAEVLRLLGDGLSNKVIASRLGISPYTVRDHVGNLMQRHQRPNRVALAVFAASRCWQIAGELHKAVDGFTMHSLMSEDALS